MTKGMPSLMALLGLVAVAGYQNRDKLREMIGTDGGGRPDNQAGPSGSGGLLDEIGQSSARVLREGSPAPQPTEPQPGLRLRDLPPPKDTPTASLTASGRTPPTDQAATATAKTGQVGCRSRHIASVMSLDSSSPGVLARLDVSDPIRLDLRPRTAPSQ